jgi:hypothetical protein
MYPLEELTRSKEARIWQYDDVYIGGKKLGDWYYYTAWAFSSLATGRGWSLVFGDNEYALGQEQIALELVDKMLYAIELDN